MGPAVVGRAPPAPVPCDPKSGRARVGAQPGLAPGLPRDLLGFAAGSPRPGCPGSRAEKAGPQLAAAHPEPQQQQQRSQPPPAAMPMSGVVSGHEATSQAFLAHLLVEWQSRVPAPETAR